VRRAAQLAEHAQHARIDLPPSLPSRPSSPAHKFKHFPVVRAVNAETNSVYCMWDDEVRRLFTSG